MICPEDTEQWRPVTIEPYDRHYEVSSWGRVRRVTGGTRNAKAGRILRPKRDRDGYLAFNLCVANVVYYARGHILVLAAFVGGPHAGEVARHRNAVRSDNHPLNLTWGTVQDNTDDRIRHGNNACGARIARARYTEAQVLAMRAAKAAGQRPSEIARHFSIPLTSLEKILYRKTWRHLSE